MTQILTLTQKNILTLGGMSLLEVLVKGKAPLVNSYVKCIEQPFFRTALRTQSLLKCVRF